MSHRDAAPKALSKDESDAQWASQFDETAPVLDAVAQEAVAQTNEQPFIADQTW